MAENRSITSHDDIREWASARAGKPMVMTVPDGAGGETTSVGFHFGQVSDGYNDVDQATNTKRLVEWDEWFETFDKEGLALVVPQARDGVIDETHQFLKR